jgi:hypothetical protein
MAKRTVALAMSLLISCAIAVQSTPAKMFGVPKECNDQIQAALQCEAQGKWKQVHWRSSMDQAKADAQRLQQPILVVIVVGKKAEKNAKEC